MPLYSPRTAYFATPVLNSPLGIYAPPISAVGAVTSVSGRTPSLVRGVGTEDERNESPAIRAFWLDNPLKPGERSTLFGFTSDYPPTYEAVRVRGNSKLAIGAAVGVGNPDLRPAALTADGEVPTPIAFEISRQGSAAFR